jgi:cell division protein FtsW (lipid II flippase)
MYGFLKGRLLFVRICLLAAALILISIGIATIYSIGNPAEDSPDSSIEDLSNKWQKQTIFAVVGLAGFIAINSINYRRLGSISYWIFAGVLVLLIILLFSKYVVVLPFAKPTHGTYRWISFSIGGRTLPSSPRNSANWRIFLPWHGT